MGMYTQIAIGVRLKDNTPETVIKMLQFITGNLEESPNFSNLPQCEARYNFFACDRWSMTLRCDSYYFDWDTKFTFTRDTLYTERPVWCLTGSSNLKNYDGEIAKFLFWIAPYLDTGADYKEFLGFTRYEEDDHPTLIYNDKGIITFVKIEGDLSA